MTDDELLASIRPLRWGEVSANADGTWMTSWRILIEPSPHTARTVSQLEGAWPIGFAAVARISGNELHVDVTTERDPMELDIMQATYDLFANIDSSIGRVIEIQGCPRDWWQPFRSQ